VTFRVADLIVVSSLESRTRRQFVGAGAIALAAAGLGIGWAKTRSSVPGGVALGSEGNLPSLDGATAWLNSTPLTPSDLSGKVVLVQFWTYTCVNWLRTLPYIRAWATKYRDNGLAVIGVHTPEFSFEHNIDNVQHAAQTMRVDYPIAVDNDYAIWNAFSNQYWPALYLADASGRIRQHHFGEGAYEESEHVLQQLLSDAGATGIDTQLVTVSPQGLEVAADWDNVKSPESYLGSAQSSQRSAAASQLRLNQWALEGDWTVGSEAVSLNEANGRIVFQFHARDLNLVMGPTTPGNSVQFQVFLDGLPPGAAHGFDVDEQGNGTLSEQRTYQLIRQPMPVSDRRFEIQFLTPGAAAYDFTFG
jgi:thiol-disulfide isomerase/thioredoxin